MRVRVRVRVRVRGRGRARGRGTVAHEVAHAYRATLGARCEIAARGEQLGEETCLRPRLTGLGLRLGLG